MLRPALLSFLILVSVVSKSQPRRIRVENGRVTHASDPQGKNYELNRPLVSFQINKRPSDSSQPPGIKISYSPDESFDPGLHARVEFLNTSADTLTLSNVVPFGTQNTEVFITGLGDHRLSRTHLFLPNKQPVNVIVPDNAWELGYSGVKLAAAAEEKMFGLTRRDVASISKGVRRRFETVLYPGGSVVYNLYVDFYTGEWQEGLRTAFQKRYLYDLKEFDDQLYERDDLKWIRKAYVMHLMMAWDKDFYDSGMFQLDDFVERGRKLYGGDDVICIWPTWPSLGIDQRNQFDLYRDLPGGLGKLQEQAGKLRENGTRFFVAYNPWDESTRNEGHLQGLAKLIQATSADGVVLDTKGESSVELQQAADEVRSGVVMYSEGMAVPGDMPGIVSGRVHNALYYPPMLNLNKFIRPDFAIFRVAEVFKEPIQREYAVAFFNGYGTEINQFAPGHPEWESRQYQYLGRTTRVLRESSDVFTLGKLTPLIATMHDSIWANEWSLGQKKLYTVFSLKPAGFDDRLLKVAPRQGFHWMDLWHHEEAEIDSVGGDVLVRIKTDAFNKGFLGTNNEGEVDCVAELPVIIKHKLTSNQLELKADAVDELRLWKGNPDYEKAPMILPSGTHTIAVNKVFGRYEGKIVIQAFRGDQLADEVITFIKPGTPRLVSLSGKTKPVKSLPGMVKIPAGKFTFKTSNGDEFIPYPKQIEGDLMMKSFLMDKFPVTNKDFKEFLTAANYRPADTANFLKHWVDGSYPKGQENFPVVFISYEDAQAYAGWADKRLPTEAEWQYAAQTSAMNEWPWKQVRPVTRKEQFVTETLTVSAIEGIDPKYCNLGDGRAYAVGSYPKGANPFGLQDLVGCVWQLTNDTYESGSYRYIIIKGGSYFKPSSSWWYVQGGPRELHYRQFLLRVSEGFERNATVGFRCVADVE